MMGNKFKIIIPSYNNEKWCEYNLASILNQTYENYEVLYIDDVSTDNTYKKVTEIVGDLPNWKIVRNKTNMRRGYNLSPYNPDVIDFMKDDEDILLFVDGDDWLYDDDVLSNINKLYQENNYWMTYGKFICYPNGEMGNPQNTHYPDYVHLNKAYRRDLWRASHLRTFKWHLYKRIKKEDLQFTKTGEFYFHAEDLATSFPCLEMCPSHKIGVVDFITYVYNVSQENRDRVESDNSREPGGYKYEVSIRESEVRNRPIYQELQSDLQITNILGGGLGNMMFQIAAAKSLAIEHNMQIVFNPNNPVGIIHRPPIEYKDSLFKSLPYVNQSVNFFRVQESNYSYAPLELPKGNIVLEGGFQSPKYFSKHSKEIVEMFKVPKDKEQELRNRHSILKDNTVSLHVRRGDYIKLSEHHHNLSIRYYQNAINYFQGCKFLIFSDDIEWCKKQFVGSEFYFVENQSDVDDLYLMSLCNHNVIANSTFSWWAAYLNQNPNKVVVYPDKWFGPKNSDLSTCDLFPEEWICLFDEPIKTEVNLFDNAFAHLEHKSGMYSHVHGRISKHVKYTKGQLNYDGITLFTDEYVLTDAPEHVKSKHKIAWLIEPREYAPQNYDHFDLYEKNYDAVLTYDKKLLEDRPNKAKLYVIGGCWIRPGNYGIHYKSKNLSMIYSNKRQIEGHRLRHDVADLVKNQADLFGRGTPNEIKYKEDALVDYRFSIVIENSNTHNFFTEKLLDCLAVGTIPVYWGCPNLSEFFDLNGIITFKSLEDLKNILPTLTPELYQEKIIAVKNNLELCKKYSVTEDYFYENVFKQLNK